MEYKLEIIYINIIDVNNVINKTAHKFYVFFFYIQVQKKEMKYTTFDKNIRFQQCVLTEHNIII